MFRGERSIISDNANVEIEVLDRTQGAGIGFDQLQFMEGGEVIVEGGSELRIVDLVSHGSINFLAANYALGSAINFATFDPLAITGQFGSVQHVSPLTTDNFVVNLATGNLVGIGDRDLDDAAANANQTAMLDGLRISSAGGVDQFYGGEFVEDLTAAWAAVEDLDAVFERASPEVYAGLGGSAQAAALNAGPKWVSDFAGPNGSQGTFIDMSTTHFAVDDQNGDQIAFGIGSTNASVGFNQAVSDDVALMFQLGSATTDLDSDYLRGSGSGLTAGIGLVGRVMNTEGLTWRAGVQHAALSLEGSRTTNNGSVSFSNVDATATQFNIGLEYQAQYETADLGLRANLAFGSTSSAAFAETAAGTNVLDAMSVNAIDDEFTQLDLGIRIGTMVSSATRIFGEADLSVPLDSSGGSVGASYDGGQGAFTVSSMGLDTPSFSASVGVDQQVTDTGVMTLSVGAGNSWNDDTDVRANLSLRFQF